MHPGTLKSSLALLAMAPLSACVSFGAKPPPSSPIFLLSSPLYPSMNATCQRRKPRFARRAQTSV